MFCHECGNELAIDTEICAKCGVPTPLYFKRNLGHKNIEDEKGMRMLLPVGRSFFAIAAGYAGLLSVFPLVGVAALVFGFIGLRNIKKNPEMIGKVRCWFGIVCGVISSSLWLVFVLIAIFK